MGKYADLLEAPKAGKYADLLDEPVVPARTQSVGGTALDLGSEALDRLTPVGSVKEIYGQLSGSRPSDSLKAGLAAADIASLGLSGKLKLAGEAAELGMKGIQQALASGAGAGAAGMAADKAGAPAWVQAIAGMGGGVAGGRLGGIPPVKSPQDILNAGEDLAKYGGQPTAAMLAKGRTGKGILGVIETSARTNPLLQGKYNAIDAANAAATGAMAESKFGKDILQASAAPKTGEGIHGILDILLGRRRAAYAPAVEALKNAPGYANYSKDIIKTVKETAKEADVAPSVRKAFLKAVTEALEGKNTPEGVDKALSHVRTQFEGQFTNPIMGSMTQREYGILEGALKDANQAALNRLSGSVVKGKPLAGTLGDQLREAKGEYRKFSTAAEPLADILNAKRDSPEQVGGAVLKAGSRAVENLKGQLTPVERKALEKLLGRTAITESIGPEGVSANKLASLLANKDVRAGGALGSTEAELQQILDAMKAARQNTLGVVNPSGTMAQSMKAGQLGAAFVPQAWPALLGKTAMDLGYTYGGVPALRATRAIARQAPSPFGLASAAAPSLRAALMKSYNKE